MIEYKDAKENMEYLKSQGASAVPFFVCSSGKSEGAVKDLDDLIQKLNLKLQSDESPASESPASESPAPESPAPESPAPEQKETYLKNLNIVDKESKNNGTQEPSGTSEPSDEQSSTQEPSGTSEPSDEQSSTQEPSGTSDEPSKSIIITKVYTNPFKTHVLNQQTKKSGKGYYTYENYLPNSVQYDSLAGQLSPAPCGNKLI
jgi:hypothetical protein